MPAASYWNAFAWPYFAKPKCDRALYHRVKKAAPQRIVEFGVGDLTRSKRVISLAQRVQRETIHYCGIDLFEARNGPAKLTLKDAHYQLSRSGAKIRLVPGDLFSALARTANILTKTDLLIIDSVHSQAELESVCQFVPRMLHDRTAIARYDRRGDQLLLCWLQPDSFEQPRRRAA